MMRLRVDRTPLVLALAAFALCVLLTKASAVSWNDASRLATIESLVDRGTLAIDGSLYAWTEDKYRRNGHEYSEKPPLLSLEGAAVASVLRPLGITFARAPRAAYFIITLITVGTWLAIGMVFAYAFQRRLGFDRRLAAAVALTTSLATLALPYALVLSNHVPAGVAILGAFFFLAGDRTTWRDAALAGFMFSLACAYDASQIVFGIGALVLLLGKPRPVASMFVAGCVPLLAAQVAYNLALSGSVVPAAINGATWATDSGSPFRQAHWSLFAFSSLQGYLAYAFQLVLGSRGLLSFTPLAAVAMYGLWLLSKSGPPARRLSIAVASYVGAFFLMTLLFTHDTAADNFGERRFVNVIFALCIGLGPALAANRRGLAGFVFRLAAALSLVVAALGSVDPWGRGIAENGAAFSRIFARSPVTGSVDLLMLAALAALLWFLSTAGVPKSRSADFHA